MGFDPSVSSFVLRFSANFYYKNPKILPLIYSKYVEIVKENNWNHQFELLTRIDFILHAIYAGIVIIL